MPEDRVHGTPRLVILDLVSADLGWLPVRHAMMLAARLFDAPVLPAPDPAPGALRKLAFRHGPRRPRCVGQPHLLIVAPRVEALGLLAAVPGWRSGFDRVSVWILDSFWTEALSTPLGMEHVDHVFITWGGDLEAYRAIAPAATTVDWLPWGTDALGLGGAPAHRPVDIQRLGRQPEEWDDDIRSMARLKAEGLRFAGRPDAGSYESLLSDHLQQARCVMAHSNLAHAVSYTHPSKEYMTARWTDAFACGCIVAGVQPRSDPLFASVDPEAVAEIGPDAGPDSLSALRSAAERWTPELGRRIHEMALGRFDWRWRLRRIAERMEISATALDADIGQITARLPNMAEPDPILPGK
jgi:hypothetical protein